MESFVIFVMIISLLIWLLSTLYTLFVSSPYKRDDNADFGEIDFEKAKQELKGRLEYPYCESATINESGTLELVCKYATYSVNIQDRKLVIESDPRPFVKPGNVVEEKDCLEAYLVKALLPETDSNPPKALEHFQRYVQFRLFRRISGWLFLVLLILCALNESGLSVINVMDVWKSKGVSQMYFTEYSEEITIGEALRAACSNCKWQNDKIGDNLYTVTFKGYGVDGSLLTILFQTNRSECSIESITLDQEDITWTQGLFLAALYESIKDDDGDDEELTLPEAMNENMFGDTDGIIPNDMNNDTEDIQDDLSYGLNEAASFELNDGGVISVTFTKYGENEDIAYINYEIENIGNTSVTVGESMFSVYANDYAAELNFGENTIYEETISKGRKVKGTLYPNMLLDKVKKLEIECGDVIFLLRDTSAVDAMLGTYYRQYEEEGNIVIDEIKLYREAYNNEGLAVSAKHHIDFGNEYDYDYDFNSWVFELYDDKIEFINHGSYMEGLTVFYSRNPREEGIDVVQSENSEIEDMFTGHYEWTDNIQAVYELVENAKQTEKSILTDDESYDSEVQGFSSGMLDNQYIGAVLASSELTDSAQTYKVDALFDGNKDTCWAEGVEGNGAGEYIKIEFSTTINLTEIYLLNGYMKNEDVYNKNGKIKRVELSFSDGTSLDVDLQECSYQKAEDQTFSDCILMDAPISTDYLKITILEAEAGTKYDDICLSEVELWGNTENNVAY